MLPYQLVCEGKADEVFFRRLLMTTGKQVDVSCPKKEEGGLGLSAIRKRLIGLHAQKDKISLLVLALDCDDDPNRAFADGQTEFQEANSEIGSASYAIPNQPNVLTVGNPQTAIAMVPGVGIQGCLDSLLLPSFEEKFSANLKCTDDFCRCLRDPARGFSRDARLRLRAIIASTQKNPGYSLANLLEEKHCPVSLDHASFGAMRNALTALFP